MFRLWRKIDSDQRLIATLWSVIVVLLVLVLLLWRGWTHAPKQLTVFVPPDLTQGATFQVNEVPKHSVYAFAFYIWQLLNTWPEDGQTDYRDRLDTLWPYVSADFKAQLEADYAQGKANGLLTRTRHIQAPTPVFAPERVEQLDTNTWQVHLMVRLTESLQGTAFKDTHMVYPLRIVRYPTPENYNPWGLVIDGFFAPPERLTDKE